MGKRILLVDYENVRSVERSHIPSDVTVRVYFGVQQRTVPMDLMELVRHLGERFAHIKVKGPTGKNALDFHIAYYLGEELARDRNTDCVILSGDTGFDALITHLRGDGYNVRRVTSSKEAFPDTSPSAGKPRAHLPSPQQVLECIRKVPADKRPRKRKGLVAHLSNSFRVPQGAIDAVLAGMIGTPVPRIVEDDKGKLTYENFRSAPTDA